MDFALSKLSSVWHTTGFSLRRHANFLRHIATLVLGNTAAVAISFLLTPIISRLFEPADFGVAALFISIAHIAGTTAPLYNRGVVLAGEDSRATLLVHLTLGVLAVICITAWLLMSLLHFLTIPIPLADQLGSWMWLLPVVIFLVGLETTLESWLTRAKAFKVLAYCYVSQSLLATSSRLSLGWAFGTSTWALLAGYALGLCGSVVLLVRASLPNLWRFSSTYSAQDLIDIAREYKDFPLYNTPTVFILSLSHNLPVLMLGYLFSPAVAGFYAMASRLVGLPLETCVNALRRVYLQKAAEIKNDGRPLRGALSKTTAGLALCGVVPFVLLWLFGESVLTIALGERWAEAGRYVEILAPWLFMVWVTAPSSLVMIVLRKQAMLLRIQLGILVFRVCVFISAYALSAPPERVLSTFALASALCNAVIVINSFRLVYQADRELSAQKYLFKRS